MNQPTKWIVGVLIAVVVVAVSYSMLKGPGAPVSTEPIKIGGIFALTGVGAAIGEEEFKGAQLAVEEINKQGGILGKSVEFTAEDVSIDKLKVAGSAAQKLINVDKVVAIVGPQWDEPAMAIIPIIDKAKMPTVGADNTDGVEAEIQSDYFFAVWYDNRVGVRELLRFARSKGWTRIAVIRPLNAGFWKFVSDEMVKSAPQHGITIVEDMDLGNPLLTDFRTPITKMKAKNPQAVFMVMADPSECVFMRQAEELGLERPILATESAGNYASLNQCPASLEKLYFSTPRRTAGYDNFEKKFEAKYGRPSQFPTAVTAYDAVMVLAQALKNANLAGGDRLWQELTRTNYRGASLPVVAFNKQGFMLTPEDAFEMQTVRGGKFVAP